LLAIEALIDDARRENIFDLLMSLNMLIEFGNTFNYSGADFRPWCRKAGFHRFEVMDLASPSSPPWPENNLTYPPIIHESPRRFGQPSSLL